MTHPSYQTIRLSRGSHASPDEGACVMELASMLAHEPFSDHPRSVCPVIAEFLRTYNDTVDDDRRQDLYAYASSVVGTRGPRVIERRRARMCLEAVDARFPLLSRLRSHFRTHAGAHAALALSRRQDPSGHERALGLLDELIAAGGEPATAPVPSEAAEAPRTPLIRA
jgi:hypothetical protein